MLDEEEFDDDSTYILELTDDRDTFVDDAADFFATTVLRQFPGVHIEAFEPTDWRRGWQITIPAVSSYTVSQVEEAAFKLQERFFWEKDILVGYTVAREELDNVDEE